jgi:hypothetical protein
LLGVDADGKVAGLRPFVADNRAVIVIIQLGFTTIYAPISDTHLATD